MPPQEVRREQYSQGRITSDVPAPLEIQAVRDLGRARGREMQAENLNVQVQLRWVNDLVRASCANRVVACLTPACCLNLQVDAALSAGQLRQSPAGSVPAEAVAVGLSAEDGNDVHASHIRPL